MFGKSKKNDLTSPEDVAKGRKVYERIERGQTKDVPAELDATYGRKTRKG